MKEENAENNLKNSSMRAGVFPKNMLVVELDAAIDCIYEARNEGRNKAVKILMAWFIRNKKRELQRLRKEFKHLKK